jgi:hypothetical protein
VSELRDQALGYAGLGWAIIPLHTPTPAGTCSCGRSVCVKSAGKHPRLASWQQVANDVDRVTDWWTTWPAANIGVVCGKRSGFFVLDVDSDKDGDKRLAELEQKHGALPATVEARTGSGGQHFFFLCPDFDLKNGTDRLGKGLDVRSDGGQVALAPSLHRSGNLYQWVRDPWKVDIAPAPSWLLALLRDAQQPAATTPRGPDRRIEPSAAVDRARKYLAKMPGSVSGSGGHQALWDAAQHLVRGFNLTADQAMALLVDDFNPRCEPPWAEKDLQHKIDDAISKSSLEWGFHLNAPPKGGARPEAKASTPRRPEPEEEPPFPTAGNAALVVLPQPNDPRPEIRITTEQWMVNDRAVEALATDENIFQRGPKLVHVVRGAAAKSYGAEVLRPPDAPRIAELAPAVLRERLTAVAKWTKYQKTSEQWVPAHPPDWAVAAIHARQSWASVRRLVGIVETPVLRPDGTVLEAPGYDERTELFYAPSSEFLPMSERPTRTEAQAALAELADPVCDFPFDRPEHRSAWLAAMLTPFARHAFDGPVPLTLIDANLPRVGKGKLADVIAIVATGRTIPRMAWPGIKNDPEVQKLITSILLSGDQLAMFDNVTSLLGGQTLELLLTTTEYKARLLSTNDAPPIPARTIWFTTANNVSLTPDMALGRIDYVRMTSAEERPALRGDFKYPNLLQHVASVRPTLVRAALTALRGYFAAGRPDMGLRSWGSYEGWSAVVRATLVWAGLPDPELTKEELSATADGETALLEQLIAGIEQFDPLRAGWTVAHLLLTLRDNGDRYPTLRSALEELVPTVNGKPMSPVSIGKRLSSWRERPVGGLCLAQDGDAHSVKVWKVRPVRKKRGVVGDGGYSQTGLGLNPAIDLFSRTLPDSTTPLSPATQPNRSSP